MTLSKFVEKYNGKQVEYHSYDPRAKYQCTDLVNQYIVDVWGLPAIIGTNAVDFPEKITSKLIFIANTPTGVPLAGDVVVFKKYGKIYGTPGHIAIVISADTKDIEVFEQNYPTGKPSKMGFHDYRGCRGWIRKVTSSQEPMPSDELQECLRQHTELVTKLDAEKKKTQSLEEQVKLKDQEVQRLNGELTEKASALKTVREELNQFMETLASKLTIIVDKSAIIGAVDRLIAGESEQLKKIKNLEDAYNDLEAEKKLEIEALKISIEELRKANETQAKHIGTLEKRIESIETNNTPTQDNKAYFEAFEKVAQAIKKLFTKNK